MSHRTKQMKHRWFRNNFFFQCSASLAINGIKLITTSSLLLTPVGMTNIIQNKNKITKIAIVYVEKEKNTYSLLFRVQTCIVVVEIRREIPQKFINRSIK